MNTEHKIITANVSDDLLAQKAKQPVFVSYRCDNSHDIRVFVSHNNAPFIAANAHPWRHVVLKYPRLAAIEFNEGQWRCAWDGKEWVCEEQHALAPVIHLAAA
jgi:hypothetical protein